MSACWGPDFPARAEGISPQTVRLVALAVADVVNDAHDYRFFAARKKVAAKVGCDPDTVGDVFRHLVDSGVMRVVRCDPGRPVEYQWTMVPGVRSSTAPLRSSTAGGAVTSPHHKTKEHSTNTRPPSASEIYAGLADVPDDQFFFEKYGLTT